MKRIITNQPPITPYNEAMKVAVIAANGRSGWAVVQELLAGGHQVVAGVHGRNTLEPHEHLTVQTCDATDLDDVKRLVKGCDAVTCFVGHVRGARADVQTAATMNMVRACRHLGISRVVSLTGTGVRFPGDQPSLLDRLLTRAVRLADPARVQDGQDHADILRASGLEWTLLRVLKLTNGRPADFRLSAHGPGKFLVPRREVAQAVRQVLESHGYVMQAPIVSPAVSQPAGTESPA